MKRWLLSLLLVVLAGVSMPRPASAALLNSGPLADFLTLFRQPGVAKRTVAGT